MQLTKHRIVEIFAAVSHPGQNIREISDKEFDEALTYLHFKSVVMSLEALGITREMVFGTLIWITFLLVLLIAFIFIGV